MTAPLAGPREGYRYFVDDNGSPVEVGGGDILAVVDNIPTDPILAYTAGWNDCRSLASPLPAEAAPKGVSVGVREALERMVALYESEYDADAPFKRPDWLVAALTQEATPADMAAGRDFWLHYDHQAGKWCVEEQPPKVIRTGAEVIHAREVATPAAGDMADLIARLRSPLPVCPFDRRSPDYWTAGENGAPCTVCGGTEDGPDKCRGADTRCMEEAAASLASLSARLVEVTLQRDQWEHACRASMADAEPAVRRAVAAEASNKRLGMIADHHLAAREAAEAKLAEAGKALGDFILAHDEGAGLIDCIDNRGERYTSAFLDLTIRRARTVHASIFREAQG